jgi:hypothetical protein
MGGPEWVIIRSLSPGITSPAGAMSTRTGSPAFIRLTASSFAVSIFLLMSSGAMRSASKLRVKVKAKKDGKKYLVAG